MPTKRSPLRYRVWYALLLRLYPRPFREQFAEGTLQTFHDLCREHQVAGRGLYGLALWIFLGTSVGIIRENTTHMPEAGKTMLRVALGSLGLLMEHGADPNWLLWGGRPLHWALRQRCFAESEV